MTRPTTRKGSSKLQFRKRVPKRYREAFKGKQVFFDFPASNGEPARKICVTVGNEIKFSHRSRDVAVVTEMNGLALKQINRLFKAHDTGPTSLTQKELVALSGDVYRLFIDQHEEEPGDPVDWAAFKAFNRAAREGRLIAAPTITGPDRVAGYEAALAFGSDLTAGVNAVPMGADIQSAMESRFGQLTDWVLYTNGLVVDPATRARLVQLVDRAATEAAWSLKKRANGDYSPDPNAQRFPAKSVSQARLALTDLFDRWQKERQPSASTLSTWQGHLRSLTKHLNAKADDIKEIAAEDIVAWKDAAVAEGTSAKTINDSYLGFANTLLNYAVANKLLADNPAKGVRAAGKSKPGTKKLPYSEAEVQSLLGKAVEQANPARRWLPWLAATTGARIGELAQLWGRSIGEEDGIHFVTIAPAPDAGTIKNEGSERRVPIHPTLIADGFLDFVAERGNGPLFYNKSSGDRSKKHASKGVSNRLASWIRGAGFADPRVDPSHGLRHYFKTAAGKRKIDSRLVDAIQGHAAKDVAGRYRHPDLAEMHEAVVSLPVPSKTDSAD